MHRIEGLHVITDREIVKPRSLLDVIELAIEGGASVIQLRDKNADTQSSIILGRQLLGLINGRVPLIVDDNLQVALEIGAQGIHVGQSDMPVQSVRKLVGDQMIVGVSASTVEEAINAKQNGAAYIGAGPVFQTKSKADAVPPIHLSGLANIKQVVDIPVIAIGGINGKNVKELKKFSDGVAVISAVLRADDPKQAAHELSMVFRSHT